MNKLTIYFLQNILLVYRGTLIYGHMLDRIFFAHGQHIVRLDIKCTNV